MLSRVYAIIIAIIYIALSGFYVYSRPQFLIPSNPLRHHNFDSQEINTTWQGYLNDCGGEKVIENYVHAKMIFNEKYENNVVSWNGYFADVKPRSQTFSLWNNDHYLSLLVKMSPSES